MSAAASDSYLMIQFNSDIYADFAHSLKWKKNTGVTNKKDLCLYIADNWDLFAHNLEGWTTPEQIRAKASQVTFPKKLMDRAQKWTSMGVSPIFFLRKGEINSSLSNFICATGREMNWSLRQHELKETKNPVETPV